MAIPVYLSNIVSSGTYAFTFDRSEVPVNVVSTLRLIIGFSKIGPFNTPVFVRDYAFFESVFGKRDKILEKKGSYFHLSAKEMLDESPIIALNLLDLDADIDKTEFISYSTSSTQNNEVIGSAPLAGNYDTRKFWKLDDEKALENIDNTEGFSNTLLNFTNVGRKRFSVIVTKTQIQGLDISAKDWYGEADVPEFMDGSDYINDYTLRVNVLKGDYSDFKTLSVDPILGEYFDINGIKKEYTDANGNVKDGLLALLENPNVVSLGEYIGVMIPGFVDGENNQLYIKDLINLETSFTGLFCSIDEDLFDGSTVLSGSVIDLLGGTIEGAGNSTINYLSYLGNINEDLVYTESLFSTGTTFSYNTVDIYGATGATSTANAQVSLTDVDAYGGVTGKYDTITLYSPDSVDVNAPSENVFATNQDWLDFVTTIVSNVSYVSSAQSDTLAMFYLVKDVALTTDKCSIQIYATKGDGSEAWIGIDGLNDVSNSITPKINVTQLSGGVYKFNNLSDTGISYESGIFTEDDDVEVATDVYESFSVSSENTTTISGFELSHPVIEYTLTADLSTPSLTDLNIKSGKGSLNKTLDVTKIDDYTFSYSVAPGATAELGDIVPSDFLVRSFDGVSGKTKFDPRTGNTRFTRIESVKEDTISQIVTVKTIDQVYFENNITVERYKSVDNFVTNYNVHSLSGFTMRDAQIPNGTVERQNEILDVLKDTNLYSALADKKAIDFRYIVDTFDGTIEASSKQILSSLCQDRQFAFAILNAPSVKAFDKSTNPLFKYDSRSDFDPIYVPSGGNQSLNPSNTFTLPSLSQGSNYCGFYHPYLVLREGNATKIVPPAAYISNNYIRKYKNGKPYEIIAGPRRGNVSGTNIVGVEYVYDRNGLDNVEPFGLNVVVPNRGIGNIINANQTAQQNIKSALSSIHVRELLIYIQQQVDATLSQYRWEFNTPATRLEIKTVVDGFLSGIQNDGGLFDYSTIMNSTNNTNELIDNDFGIIDIYIEPVRGMKSLISRTTILKTGGISAGDFQIA